MVYNPPQGNAYIPQQNPYVAQQGPQWYAHNQHPGPQPLYEQNYQAYNPYGQNPPGQNIWGLNFSKIGWNVNTGPYQRPPMPFNPQLIVIATLELPDVSKVTNDPILHNP